MGKKKKAEPTPSLFDEDQPVPAKPQAAEVGSAKAEELPPRPPGVPGLPADLDHWRRLRADARGYVASLARR